MLPSCLLLQILKYCTAHGTSCKDSVERLNGGTYSAAIEVGEDWDRCRSVFFENASSSGASLFLTALDEGSWAATGQIAQDVANTEEFAGKVNIEQLKILTTHGATISSQFFAKVSDIEDFGGPSINNADFPKNILEYYNGPMRDTSWMTAEQFKLFGSKLGKTILCTKLVGSSISAGLLASISLECFRGLIQSKSSFGTWSSFCPGMIADWLNHIEEDFQHVNPDNYQCLPTSVWQEVLGSPTLLEFVPDNQYNLESPNLFKVSLSKIGHVRFAEIVRQRPNVALSVIRMPIPELPVDIFASCGKEEMKSLTRRFLTPHLWKNPEIIGNISSAVDDDKHFCNGMDAETYHDLIWLRANCSAKCRSFISVPDGYDKEKLPELVDGGSIWDSHVAQIKANHLPDIRTTGLLIASRSEFCELMAEKVSSDELENLDSIALGMIGAKCALALKSLITREVAQKLRSLTFRLFTADDFKLKMADITLDQIEHLSKSVPKESSVFTKIETAELLEYSNNILSVLTDSQIGAIQVKPEYLNWISFRRQAARLLKEMQQDDLKKLFESCLAFKGKETLGFEHKECANVLSGIILNLSGPNWESSVGFLFNDTNLHSLLYELLSKETLLKLIQKSTFNSAEDFKLKHDGRKYNLAHSLQTIRESHQSLSNPQSTICHSGVTGVGPLRGWLGDLLDTMKTNMVSNTDDIYASIQKFKFPIKGVDGPPAGFLAGKAMQKKLKLPFALDPKFYELILNENDDETETYFKTTYAEELRVFRDNNLYQRVTSNSFKLTHEQKDQVEQIKREASMTPCEKTKAIERVRNKAWFESNRNDFGWAPLSELTFNGFENTSNYNDYRIPRGELSYDEWEAKCGAVYSVFEYEHMEEFFEKFSANCLQEFKTFVKGFRSGLELFLRMPKAYVENKQPFTEILVSKINGVPMTADKLFSKITVKADADIASWYGDVKSEVFFKVFLDCLTPEQLSKLVAVWTGAASTDLDRIKPKILFYVPTDGSNKYNSREAIENLAASSGSIVIHGGNEHEAFLRQFSAKLREAMGSDKDVVDPLSDGNEHVEFYPSVNSATCFSELKFPLQHSRMLLEALIWLLNDDPSSLSDR
ncbi:hypothetical protein PSACC_03195 [Paramicrosporidium saccamoebae]|uniref:HECT domain-containing protein n=1 Tax=Paramicrosporidium saccamoebae TaxID=1246581 RepID=A0A2H9TGT8_9FUNG|nr:hypothetical protein PSACC_03195 [Paramicrosporidium saccamoebae]